MKEFALLGNLLGEVEIHTGKCQKSKLPKYLKDATINLTGLTFDSVDLLIQNLQKWCNRDFTKHIPKLKKCLVYNSDFSTIKIKKSHIMPKLMYNYLGKDLEINITEYKRQRTKAQNRYLHGVVLLIIVRFERERGAEWIQHKDYKQAKGLVKSYIYLQ